MTPDQPPRTAGAPDPSAQPPSHADVLEQLARRQRPATGGGEPPAPQDPPRYRHDGEIARGGMGAILKVWDSDLRRTLAMKVILDGTQRPTAAAATDDVRLGRFLDEAQITGQLDHPGVVPVHELGVDAEGRVYFTMRLVRGRDFATVIALAREGRDGWTRTRALDALLRVCETMAFAHQKGVVHRDLKPANIMVGQFGETYVMDWGLARVLGEPPNEAQQRRDRLATTASLVYTARRGGDDGAPRTEAGVIVGTPCYMPPEQAAGELESIGPQSDVYAVGAMLYQLLTGVMPYEDTAGSVPLAVVTAVLAGAPTPMHRLDRTIPTELVAIVERAMSRAPEARYPTMVEMAADLRAYLECRVVKAYKTGALVEFRKWITRNKAVSCALAALVVVAGSALLAFAWLQHGKAIEIAAEQRRTQTARDDALANLAQAREQGYVANVTAASASLAAGEIRDAKRYLADCAPELRGFEWRHLALRADASVAVLQAHAGTVTDLAFAGDGQRLASSSTDGSVRVWQALSGAEPLSLPGESAAGDDQLGSALSFAGARVVAFGRGRDAQIRAWDATTGDLASRLALPAQAVFAIATSRDGARVALGAPDHTIRVVDAATGAELGSLAGHRATVRALAFSADGARLASGAEDRTVRVWDVARGTEVASADVTATAHSLAFAPDGNDLAVGLEDGALLGLDARTCEQRTALRVHSGPVYALAFDAAGGKLATASFDKSVRLWRAADRAPLATLLGHDDPVRALAWSHDGALLASGSEDRTIRLWDVAREGAVTIRRGAADVLSAVDVGGEHIAVGSGWPGVIEIVNRAAGATGARIRGPEDSVAALAFAPGRDRFAVAYEEECSVRIGSTGSTELGAPLLGHEASVTAVAWSPDGATIASASADQTVRFWDAARNGTRGAPLRHESPVTALAFAPGGDRVATGTRGGTARVFDAATETELASFAACDGPVHALAWAPDGATLALGGDDGRIHVVTAGGAPVAEFAGHNQRISSLAFLRDGTRLASGSFDATVRVWDAKTARLLATLRGHEGPVTGIAWASDGALLASTSLDGTLRIWRAERPAK